MFINISNHPSSKWSQEQIIAAKKLGGDIIDIPFPIVPTRSSTKEIEAIADIIHHKIMSLAAKERKTTVMIQGEFTLTHLITNVLIRKGIICVCACSDRVVNKIVLADGTVKKEVKFKFVQFRPYSQYGIPYSQYGI